MGKRNFGNSCVDELDDPSAGLSDEEKAVNLSKLPHLTQMLDKAEATADARKKRKYEELRGAHRASLEYAAQKKSARVLYAVNKHQTEGRDVRPYEPIPGRGGPDYKANKLARRAVQRLEKKTGETPEQIKERKDRDAERKFLSRIQKEIAEKGLTGSAAQEFMSMRRAKRAGKRQLR